MASDKTSTNSFLCIVDYLGTTLIDKRFSGPMLPWVIAEIKLRGQREKMQLAVQEGWVRATPVRGKESRQGPFQHSLAHIIRFSQVYTNHLCFLYLLREPGDPLVACYLFEAKTSGTVVELFSAMREQAKEAPYGRSQSSAASLTSLCADISPSSSQYFEVLYIGKIKVSHKKVPDTFIDEALERFRLHDQEKLKRARLINGVNNSTQSAQSQQIGVNVTTNINNNNIPNNVSSESQSNNSDVSTTKLTVLRCSNSPENNTISNGSAKNINPKLLSPASSSSSLNYNSIDNRGEFENNKLTYNSRTNNDNLDGLVNLKEIGKSSSGGNEKLIPLSEVGRSASDEIKLSKSLCDEIKLRKPMLGQVEKPLLGSVETLTPSQQNNVISPCQDIPPMRTRTSSGDTMLAKQQSLDSLPGMRVRAGSTGSTGSPARMRRQATTTAATTETAPTSDHNRTMLFLVGRTDLRLISPDRKQVLLHKQLRDVATCVQGQKNSDHFGFICRETNVDNFVGYVFKCQSGSVVTDVVGAIVQANQSTSEAQRRERREGSSCEHCPMVWYHKLCAEVEGLGEKRQQAAIFRRMEQLPPEEQDMLMEKLRGGSVEGGLREQTELLMVLLRVHCEAKQSRHMHDTAENRSEFLNQYLGGGSTIFMKAKRSLTSSFDTLLKRRGSRDELIPFGKELSLPVNATITKGDGGSSGGNSPCIGSPRGSPAPSLPPSREEPEEEPEGQVGMRPRSSTVGTSGGETMKREFLARQQSTAHHRPGPMMNIFLKVGNSPKTPPSPVKTEPKEDTKEAATRTPGSWRQAIFQRVVTPNKALAEHRGGASRVQHRTTKRSREELRQLWRKAINQQRLLIRMEKENARLRARQEEATVKRIKLEYDEISPCAKEGAQIWDLLLSRSKSDTQMLLQALRQGVPRAKRGEVWQFLAEKHNVKCAPPDLNSFPNYCVPYEDLLKQLTSHQHGILIDLGRTFPSHAYFASPLGPGQLALFNLLKAYSLLDPEVGYCQGLSFVAGVLLLHVSEESAFALLKHVMFRRGLRKVYLPDMVALQVNLYQLSRLLHDLQPDLYAHFDSLEVAPTLYAAPWVLTLFASQFPLGFVARIFDLILLEGSDVIFRFAVALLAEHRERLMACDSFEEVMDYLKTQVPNVTKGVIDRVTKQVFQMEVSRQLREYEVEYHVLQEELATQAGQPNQLAELRDQNQELLERLEIAEQVQARLETSRSLQQATINRLESQVRSLESTLAAMARHIASTPAANDTLPTELRRYVSRFTVPTRANSDGNRATSPILKVTPVNELTSNLNVQFDDESHKEHPLDMICTDVNFRVGSLPRGGTRRSPQPSSRSGELSKSAVSRGGS